MIKAKLLVSAIAMIGTFGTASAIDGPKKPVAKTPVDYVNPNIGNISHMLVPTYPTTHLPNSMMRVFPVRHDYTTNYIGGLPLIVTQHRAESSFNFYPYQGAESGISPQMNLSYDQEQVTPYRYKVYLDELNIGADYAPSYQSAVYKITFDKAGTPYLVFNCRRGKITANGNVISGSKDLGNKTTVYLYAITDATPVKVGVPAAGGVTWNAEPKAAIALQYPASTKSIGMRYGVSFISIEQAKKNLEREIKGFDVNAVAAVGRAIWNNALGKIAVSGASDKETTVFYTSLYRTYERQVNISEDGRYFSASDGKVHSDEGHPFYTDDWLWDTYRAAHPLRILINKDAENDILRSYILAAQQTGQNWLPTFPGVAGDERGMNSNHGIASIADAWNKGLRGFDLAKAYEVSKGAIEDKSLIPWSHAVPAGELDEFYKKNGYFPALKPGEEETVANVSKWEKRQPIAVTLGTSFDEWCLSQIAQNLGKADEAKHYLKASYNYRNVFNPKTGFFHPKDKDGKFIEPLDYRTSGGPGARDYYDENNGYIYRWDVQHNIGDLVALVGGNKKFVDALENMFNEPYPMARWSFYNILPDHTGNVGMFSMANEPSFHIPYLYNYAGAPWRTQKRIRSLLDQWYRNDLMGVPGDEDGGGMTAFVVFSQLGFYPVTPGSPTYNIGSPCFPYVKMNMGNGKYFEIKAPGASFTNKYIQSAKLNGKVWDKPWFSHSDIANGGVLELVMGPVANKAWGVSSPPPSAAPMPQ
ncbi:glycoside hydrolase family 92 protein [Mucilaginibacter pallidiroseus]|uniref:Glycoside hydrolase family 92 protein n=1 Tax=Mucilaginibacter pallidiroseus TaxID=2599295 RepID=A0A563UFX6_9SPHI|nr:GH92 family glycosyl hydrolase [Mucilaginibacter pallidiroseus]TWR30264.1 glycoside hydrolase family 92 protein [Mucilaginibacter pallidiroseus]